jgi:hypothetical protein
VTAPVEQGCGRPQELEKVEAVEVVLEEGSSKDGAPGRVEVPVVEVATR